MLNKFTVINYQLKQFKIEEMFDLIDESEYTKPSDEADSNENNQKNHAMELDVDKNSNHSSLNNKRKFDPKVTFINHFQK